MSGQGIIPRRRIATRGFANWDARSKCIVDYLHKPNENTSTSNGVMISDQKFGRNKQEYL
tara:strand:+ start:490 stop:669 length:180 start_codon:yes stop_codon:yes gene_type:complete